MSRPLFLKNKMDILGLKSDKMQKKVYSSNLSIPLDLIHNKF